MRPHMNVITCVIVCSLVTVSHQFRMYKRLLLVYCVYRVYICRNNFECSEQSNLILAP